MALKTTCKICNKEADWGRDIKDRPETTCLNEDCVAYRFPLKDGQRPKVINLTK